MWTTQLKRLIPCKFFSQYTLEVDTQCTAHQYENDQTTPETQELFKIQAHVCPLKKINKNKIYGTFSK